jgi:hypothetical protein
VIEAQEPPEEEAKKAATEAPAEEAPAQEAPAQEEEKPADSAEEKKVGLHNQRWRNRPTNT